MEYQSTKLTKNELQVIAFRLWLNRLRETGGPTPRDFLNTAKKVGVNPRDARIFLDFTYECLERKEWKNGFILLRRDLGDLGEIAILTFVHTISQDGIPRDNDIKRQLPRAAKKIGITKEAALEFYRVMLPLVLEKHIGCKKVTIEW